MKVRTYIDENGIEITEKDYGKWWEIEYTDKDGYEIVETSTGYVYVNGDCVEEPGTDEDFDTHAVDVMNGNGYYNSAGNYVNYGYEE